ncbi:MAG: hypothetical protein KC684_07590 [Candidatus Omnitrophica bacterium]|nr:hypothetical protein [Candidatus Omnitrophota bacterium]
MLFFIKILISAILIAFASWLAGKRPILAGFIIALPLASMLALIFAYFEHHDMVKINKFAVSILVAVPLSLTFFIPFLLNKWIKLNFVYSFLSGLVLLAIAYFIHSAIFKAG